MAPSTGAILMTELLVICPTHVPVSKAKIVPVNLNWYRNAHFQSLNKAKVNFKKAIESQVLALPVLKKVALTFTFHPGKGIIPDTSNVCCIADKFFCDALVELGRLPDDTRKFVLGTQYLPGLQDTHNPRIEVRIHLHE